MGEIRAGHAPRPVRPLPGTVAPRGRVRAEGGAPHRRPRRPGDERRRLPVGTGRPTPAAAISPLAGDGPERNGDLDLARPEPTAPPAGPLPPVPGAEQLFRAIPAAGGRRLLEGRGCGTGPGRRLLQRRP